MVGRGAEGLSVCDGQTGAALSYGGSGQAWRTSIWERGWPGGASGRELERGPFPLLSPPSPPGGHPSGSCGCHPSFPRAETHLPVLCPPEGRGKPKREAGGKPGDQSGRRDEEKGRAGGVGNRIAGREEEAKGKGRGKERRAGKGKEKGKER